MLTCPSGICRLIGNGVGTAGSGFSTTIVIVGVADGKEVDVGDKVWVGELAGFGVEVAASGGCETEVEAGEAGTLDDRLHARHTTSRIPTTEANLIDMNIFDLSWKGSDDCRDGGFRNLLWSTSLCQ